jgi:hypothetical protein
MIQLGSHVRGATLLGNRSPLSQRLCPLQGRLQAHHLLPRASLHIRVINSIRLNSHTMSYLLDMFVAEDKLTGQSPRLISLPFILLLKMLQSIIVIHATKPLLRNVLLPSHTRSESGWNILCLWPRAKSKFIVCNGPPNECHLSWDFQSRS